MTFASVGPQVIAIFATGKLMAKVEIVQSQAFDPISPIYKSLPLWIVIYRSQYNKIG